MQRRHAPLLASKEFHQRYFSYLVEGRTRQRLPLLHVRLMGKQTFKTVALVDSGATVTFIPPDLAATAELAVEERNVPAEGAGGDFMNDICAFRIEVLKGKDVVAEISGKAHVPQEEGRIPFCVLGRDYLFELYDITFREKDERIVFRFARR